MTHRIWKTIRAEPLHPDNACGIVERLFNSHEAGLTGTVLMHHRHDIYYIAPTRREKKTASLGPIYTLARAKNLSH